MTSRVTYILVGVQGTLSPALNKAQGQGVGGMHGGSSACCFRSQPQYIGLSLIAGDNWYIKKKPGEQRGR